MCPSRSKVDGSGNDMDRWTFKSGSFRNTDSKPELYHQNACDDLEDVSVDPADMMEKAFHAETQRMAEEEQKEELHDAKLSSLPRWKQFIMGEKFDFCMISLIGINAMLMAMEQEFEGMRAEASLGMSD